MTDNLNVCYFCGATENVDLHHCVHGKDWRKLSTQYHLLVGLCTQCHRGKDGVHGKFGQEKDLLLKSEAQLAWEARRVKRKKSTSENVRQEWIDIFQHNFVAEYNELMERKEQKENE